MTKEEREKAIAHGKEQLEVFGGEHAEFIKLAIEALETLEEFERSQIITGGRFNGRTYAYKCGLEDGKRKALEQQPSKDMGEVSDGYHTFNQLYHQRAILFATIVNQNKNISWKSYKHSDGKYCFDSNGEWFIVGIDTPEGSYTYHYKKEYWDYFECKELDCGKEWDGHTEEDVTRLLSLKEYTLDQLEAEIDWEKEWLAYAGYNACNVGISFDSIKNILHKIEGGANND